MILLVCEASTSGNLLILQWGLNICTFLFSYKINMYFILFHFTRYPAFALTNFPSQPHPLLSLRQNDIVYFIINTAATTTASSQSHSPHTFY